MRRCTRLQLAIGFLLLIMVCTSPKALTALPGKVVRSLRTIPETSRVAVVTMLGSLCPVTRGHVQGFVEARKILLGGPGVSRPAKLENFDAVVGFISLNGDLHVMRKLCESSSTSLDVSQRRQLVQLAVKEYCWLAWEQNEGWCVRQLEDKFPKMKFVHFCLNGADDVVRYEKFKWSGPQSRFITMGRPGYTKQVEEGMAEAGVDSARGYFILGPELENISSTQARTALQKRDVATLKTLLHPNVLKWCLERKAFQANAEEH